MQNMRKGVALLITVLFIMAITLAIGVGLRQVKEASLHVENASFLLQTNTLLEDVLNILKDSKELEIIATEKSSLGFFAFLSSVSFIPFESSGLKVSIEIKSARAKLNPNSLLDGSAQLARVEALEKYLSKKMLNPQYVTLLLDITGGIKEDNSYNSAIFNEKPTLFRDYIVSQKHLEEVNDFYMKTYHDNTLKNIDFTNIFYFSQDKKSKIDLNYASSEVWEILLGCDETRARELTLGAGGYTTLDDLDLSDAERAALFKFDTTFFEPFLDVVVHIAQNSASAKIKFEYNISTKKGYNFAYEI